MVEGNAASRSDHTGEGGWRSGETCSQFRLFVSENRVWRQGANTLGLIQLWLLVQIHLFSGCVVPDGMIVSGIWCNVFAVKCLLVGAKPVLGA